jgi:hypothetical protein
MVASRIGVALLALPYWLGAADTPPTPDPLERILQAKIERMKNQASITEKQQEAAEVGPFLDAYIEPNLRSQGYALFLSDLEESRWNKQTGTGASAAGSTSVVSKGSVPALFGFAVENGALTRSMSGTTITFRTSPANVIAALAKHGYINAGPAIPDYDGSFESIIKRASLYVAYDTSRGNVPGTTSAATTSNGTVSSGSTPFTGDGQQLSGWGVRFDIWNRRDPRHPRYNAIWQSLGATSQQRYANRLNDLMRVLNKSNDYQTWRSNLMKTIETAKPEDYMTILKKANTDFQAMIKKALTPADEQQFLAPAANAEAEYASKRVKAINAMMKSFTAAFEYNVIKQANTNGQVMTTSGAQAHLPDLGNANFVFSKGFSDGPEFTLNAGFSWFQNLPPGLNVGTLRDVQASGQLDFPLGEIDKIGKPTFTLAGLFLSLRQEPLGQR